MAICIASLEKCLCRSSFFNWIFFFWCWVVWEHFTQSTPSFLHPDTSRYNLEGTSSQIGFAWSGSKGVQESRVHSVLQKASNLESGMCMWFWSQRSQAPPKYKHRYRSCSPHPTQSLLSREERRSLCPAWRILAGKMPSWEGLGGWR